MKEHIKILENDIKELIKAIKKERTCRKDLTVLSLDNGKYVCGKESDENKNYNCYKKLIDTIIRNFSVYKRMINYKELESDIFYNEFKLWLEEEINKVHELMVDSKNRDNYEQYRCLNYVYTKLLCELDNYEKRKPKTSEDLKVLIDSISTSHPEEMRVQLGEFSKKEDKKIEDSHYTNRIGKIGNLIEEMIPKIFEDNFSTYDYRIGSQGDSYDFKGIPISHTTFSKENIKFKINLSLLLIDNINNENIHKYLENKIVQGIKEIVKIKIEKFTRPVKVKIACDGICLIELDDDMDLNACIPISIGLYRLF